MGTYRKGSCGALIWSKLPFVYQVRTEWGSGGYTALEETYEPRFRQSMSHSSLGVIESALFCTIIHKVRWDGEQELVFWHEPKYAFAIAH